MSAEKEDKEKSLEKEKEQEPEKSNEKEPKKKERKEKDSIEKEKDTCHPDLDVVGGVFEVGRKLGSGSFGVVHMVVDTLTGEELALKVEKDDPGSKLLHEARILMRLQGGVGITNVHWFDTENDFNLIVMDLLGPSLGYIFKVCNRKFSLKTVLLLADQMLHRLEHIHNKGVIHRDIKPENFLIGNKEKANMIYLIDFGLAKEFRNSSTGQHVQNRERSGERGRGGFVGTVRYASVNAHLGEEQSRRDDLEAASYLLLYFLRGSLPWQGITAQSKEEKKDLILESKRNDGVDLLRAESPPSFVSLLTYCRSLHFEDKPNYAYLRRIFKNVSVRKGFINNGMMDWSQPQAENDVPRIAEDRDIGCDSLDESVMPPQSERRVDVGNDKNQENVPEDPAGADKQVSRLSPWRGQKVILAKFFGACWRRKAADASEASRQGLGNVSM